MKFNLFKKHPGEQAPTASRGPRHRFWHKAHTDPLLSWTLILAAAFALALGLVGVGVSVYLDTGARLSAPPSASAQAARTPLNVQSLEGVLREFDARAKEYAAIRNGYRAPSDPSLP